jgi:SAM-dependent methyltransferase
MDARSYWNDFYTHQKNEVDIQKPSIFLSEIWERLSKGLTLDLAMGSGENAVFLSQKGFKVRGFDVSDVAIEMALHRAEMSKISMEARRCDLDLHVFGLMEYDSVLMMNFKPSISRYYSEIIRSLKQGGTLVIEAPLISEMKEAVGKNESYKDIYFHSNEVLKELGKDLRILFYNESRSNGVQVVQCLAMKPIDRDAERYKLFDLSATTGGDSSRSSKQLELAEKLFSSTKKT